MPFKRSALIAAAIMLVSAGTANAQMDFYSRTETELYFGVQGGYNSLFGPDINDEDVFSDPEAVGDFDGGFAAGVVAGIRMSEGVSFELEATRRDNSILAIEWSDAVRPTDGEIRSNAYMANVLVDLMPGEVRPYIGFGIGAARVEFRNISDANGTVLDGIRTLFAGQAMAGASFEVRPGTRISADYRFFSTLEVPLSFGSPQRPEIDGRSADVEYMQQTIMIGIRQSF